jgi:divalent metal cation (Fe/Co/Zn/Cd) transporter
MEDGQLFCLLDLIETIVTYMFGILLVLAGLMIIWGAFEFVLSGGDMEMNKNARNKLIWALVGVAVAFAARGLVRLVEMLLS